VVSDSSIYVGRVAHRRYLPKVHAFTYGVMMFSIFLDEIEELRSTIPGLRVEGDVTGVTSPRRWSNALPGRFTIRRSDFLPDYAGTLDEAARAMYRDLTGTDAPGRVAMLANLRSLGWNFNPITLFFFYDGDRVAHAVAEVTNTPWRERHLYLLGPSGTTVFDKAHHVSPFLEMNGRYQLAYSEPGDRFTLSMTLFDVDETGSLGPRRFSAAMNLSRTPLTRRVLAAVRRRYPDMAFRVSLRIYLQAARLFAKRIHYVPHPPSSLKGSDDVSTR